ncbi:MAG: molybdopterin-dependent oxidoreductase [Nannocystis sp.]|nr:molybdopterin-dependent oxidoreductase [Nannocystis sp.]
MQFSCAGKITCKGRATRADPGMVFPTTRSVKDAAIRGASRRRGAALDGTPGLTVVEIMAAAIRHEIRGMHIMGENPFVSDPNSNKVRKALASLDFLAVQDIFLTETARSRT